MNNLLREILRTGEISLTLKGLTAKGGLGIFVVFIIALIVLLRFAP